MKRFVTKRDFLKDGGELTPFIAKIWPPPMTTLDILTPYTVFQYLFIPIISSVVIEGAHT